MLVINQHLTLLFAAKHTETLRERFFLCFQNKFNAKPSSSLPCPSLLLSSFSFLPSLSPSVLVKHFLLRKIYLQIHWKLFPPLRGFTEN